MSELLDEAERKLRYADFLLNREETDPYAKAATNHVNEAVMLVLKDFTDLDDTRIQSQQLLKQTFNKFGEKEAKDFLKFYFKFKEFVDKGTAKNPEINEAIRETRNFINWIKERGI